MPRFGESQYGDTQYGTVEDTTEAAVPPAESARHRFDDWAKSAFDTDDGTDWDALLTTLADEFDTIEAVRRTIRDQQYLTSATGAQLDKLGERYQLTRWNGETDKHFRKRIQTQIPKYSRGATIDDVIEVSAALLDAPEEQIELVEPHDTEPARFDVFLKDQIVSNAVLTEAEYEGLLQEVKAGGVKVNTVIGKQFTHRSEADYTNGVNDADRAYASEDGTVEGGPYADLIASRHRGGMEIGEDQPILTGFGEGGWGSGGFGE